MLLAKTVSFSNSRYIVNVCLIFKKALILSSAPFSPAPAPYPHPQLPHYNLVFVVHCVLEQFSVLILVVHICFSETQLAGGFLSTEVRGEYLWTGTKTTG